MSDEPKISNPQPEAGPMATHSTVPMWIFSLMLVLIYLGAVYFDHHGGWFSPDIYAPYKSADELEMYQPKSGAAALLAQGKQIYERNCGICHGADGAGKPGQYPPLAGSEWVNAKGFQRLAQIPLDGLNGPIKVKGQEMNFPSGMVAIGSTMSDSDLASVLTYIRSSWGNKGEPVNADDVKKIREKIGAHPQPLSGDQLMKMPE